MPVLFAPEGRIMPALYLSRSRFGISSCNRTSMLKHPSVKLLVKYLNDCKAVHLVEEHASLSKPNLQTWTCTLSHGTFNFSVVWIQGHILEVEDGGKRATISDGTGKVVMTACDKVSTKSEMKKGMYMMAVGTLTGCPESPQIKPFKLQNLSHVDHAKESWPLEVVDQIHYLTSQVK